MRGTTFDPRAVDAFRISHWDFDPHRRVLRLHYAFAGDPGSERFVETVTFETEPRDPGRSGLDAWSRAVTHLHIAAGTSYYKAAAPERVVVESAPLTAAEASFHHLLYDDGLREFAVTNGLPVPRPVRIEHPVRTEHPVRIEHQVRIEAAAGGSGRRRSPAGPTPSRPRSLLVPIGGGKDSLVVIEALRSLEPTLFVVNPRPVLDDLVSATGLDAIRVRRELSPELGRLNRAGALNGHVPVTAIVSLLAVASSVLYGFDDVVMAVERSASEETRTIGGVPVNHQFSKSLDLERRMQELVTGSIDPGIHYGSGLRPYAELSIGSAFAGLTAYHPLFCSCNAAYRSTAGPAQRWCGACPKCRFVALMLAPFLSRDAVTGILGRDLFDQSDEVAGFRALMSDADKPFECVGERKESAAALRMLARRPGWRDTVVVRSLRSDAEALVSEGDVADLLRPDHTLDYADPAVAAAIDRLLAPGEVPATSPAAVATSPAAPASAPVGAGRSGAPTVSRGASAGPDSP